MAKKRIKKLTVTQQIMIEAKTILNEISHDLTRKLYTRNFKKFVKFCREKYAVKSLSECTAHIQEYSFFLQKSGYTASTVHSYIAAACKVCHIKMNDIQKPIRHTSEFIRGRTKKDYPRVYEDINDPRWAYLVEFQRRVGIRKNELKNLTGDCFLKDESGYYCVLVKRGKGGKRQLQRLNPSDVPYIQQYFKGKSVSDKIFEDELLENRLNLHSLRAENAKACYQYVVNRMKYEKGYEEKALAECRARWMLYNINPKTGKAKPFPEKEFQGDYILRGKNRQLAKKRGMLLHYSKLGVMFTSIFVLSHWRCDVTVANYILA